MAGMAASDAKNLQGLLAASLCTVAAASKNLGCVLADVA